MPSKIQLDENLWFLYICLQKSDYKAIDFNAVGDATQLKPPAARMRYTRLRRAIESGTLIGTHGTPFQGATDKESGHQKRRKKPLLSARSEGAADISPIHTRSGNSFERKTKPEEVSADESATGGTSEEDEPPLIKKRTKLSSHCETSQKNEVCSSESPSPVLSHKRTVESGMLCDEEVDATPKEYPLFTTSSGVDRLSSKMEIPKMEPGVTPATFSKLEPRGSGEDPGAGGSTPASVSADYFHALCGAEDKQSNHIDTKQSLQLGVYEKIAPLEWHTGVRSSGQRVKNEVDEAKPILKAEKLPAEQNVTFELPVTKSAPNQDTLFATGLHSLLSNSHRAQEEAKPLSR